MDNWRTWVNKKVILFCVGFIGYILLELAFRQYSFAFSGVLGGITILLLDSINNYWSFEADLLLQCITGSAIITYIELIIGEFVRVNGLGMMWNYSNVPLNYDGVICLPFSLIWILLSAVGILIADAINYYWMEDDEQPYYKLFGKEILRFKKK